MSVFARNPFEPNDLKKETSNNNQISFEDFSSLKFTLPSSARIIRKITIEYQNVDGSVATMQKDILKQLDWHKPIIVKHDAKRMSDKTKYTEVFLKDPIAKVSYLGRYMRINTRLKIKNQFFLSNPYRVVIDFGGSFVGNKQRQINGDFFRKINVSSHENFVRMIIELDTYYAYVIEKTTSGYLLGLR